MTTVSPMLSGPPARAMTAREFLAIPSSKHSELVRGRVVPMPPGEMQHAVVIFRVGFRLMQWNEGERLIHIGGEAAVVTERDPDTVRGPDIVAIRRDRLSGRQLPTGPLAIAPDLVVDVLSPSNRPSETLEKVAEYLAAGVQAFWLVDVDARTVTAIDHQSGSQTWTAEAVLTTPVLPGFACPVADFFVDV